MWYKLGRQFKQSYDKTRALRERLRRWFILSVAIGSMTGVAVSLLDYIISSRIFKTLKPFMSTALLVVAIPTVGLFLAGLVLGNFAAGSDALGTEEFIKKFHEPKGIINLLQLPAKILAAMLTVGFGGSAGLEGPSIYLGASVGTFVHSSLGFLKLKPEDLKTMMIAGGAAGISAIFKAPLTGVVFALEVPYKDDLAREALIPALVSSVTAYLVLVTFMGISPLFEATGTYTINSTDLLVAIALGLVCGLAARFFVGTYRKTETFFSSLNLSMALKTAIGGLVCGLAGLASMLMLGSPFLALGPGYDSVRRIIVEAISVKSLIGLIFLKAIATIATLASGGFGGIFIPMILLGGSVGALFGKVLPTGDKAHLYPIIGMTAFLASGYKTPLAAVTFIAETTGSQKYIIPGLVAAAVGYTVSGWLSVSRFQWWTKMTKIEHILSKQVGEVMTKDVVTIPHTTSISAFIHKYFMVHKYKSFPVVKDRMLHGIISIDEIAKINRDEWDHVTVFDVASTNVNVCFSYQPVSEVLEVMNTYDIRRMLVVDAKNTKKLVGIISLTDIVALDEIAALAEATRQKSYSVAPIYADNQGHTQDA